MAKPVKVEKEISHSEVSEVSEPKEHGVENYSCGCAKIDVGLALTLCPEHRCP